jgi:hypothetical protein
MKSTAIKKLDELELRAAAMEKARQQEADPEYLPPPPYSGVV